MAGTQGRPGPMNNAAPSSSAAVATAAMMYRVRFSVRRASVIHRITPASAPT